VKADSRLGIITACSGCEFVKYEPRRVPAGFEGEAERNPYLDLVAEPLAAPAPGMSTDMAELAPRGKGKGKARDEEKSE